MSVISTLEVGLQQKINAALEAVLVDVPGGDARDGAVGYVLGFCFGYLGRRVGLSEDEAKAFTKELMDFIQKRVIEVAVRNMRAEHTKS